jgi:soluble lytic murein transglycosylase-like protein
MRPLFASLPSPLRHVAIGTLVFDLVLFAALVVVILWPYDARAAQTQPLPEAQRYQLTLRREVHRVWGLGGPVATIAAQVQQESRWREDARSPVGATGLAQFMPSTANWIGGLDGELTQRAPTNPAWALRAVVVYDKWLTDRIKADAECERLAFALSAYNGGLGWVYRRQKLSQRPGVCLGATCAINPGVNAASQRENEHYPQAIIRTEPAYLRWGPGGCST